MAKIAARKLKVNRVAIVIGKTIYLYNTTPSSFISNKKWLCHELKHVEQYEQLGVLLFLTLYLWESIKKGYRNNKFEVAARAAEEDRSLLSKYDLSMYITK